MTGEEKLSSELFYVQDLQHSCPTCEAKLPDRHVRGRWTETRNGKNYHISTYDDFSFHWLVPPTSQPHLHFKEFEDQLTSDSSSTTVLHAGCYTLDNQDKNQKYKIGSPLLNLCLKIDKVVSDRDRIFVNNLYENIHDKVYPLPLGITRKEIVDFKHLRKNNKEHFCYANFSITHNYRGNIIRWASGQENINCHFTKRFPDLDKQLDDEVFADDLLPFDEFLSTLASHKFCIVPNGVGIDTDRLWECIFMNVVPIVQNNYGNRIFSKIWPMILVDMYEFCDMQRLTTEFEERHGKNIQYNHDLLLRKNLPELMDRIEHECGVEA